MRGPYRAGFPAVFDIHGRRHQVPGPWPETPRPGAARRPHRAVSIPPVPLFAVHQRQPRARRGLFPGDVDPRAGARPSVRRQVQVRGVALLHRTPPGHRLAAPEKSAKSRRADQSRRRCSAGIRRRRSFPAPSGFVPGIRRHGADVAQKIASYLSRSAASALSGRARPRRDRHSLGSADLHREVAPVSWARRFTPLACGGGSMSEQLHARAERLIAQERVEGLPATDQQWLRHHLAECARCAEHTSVTEQAIRALRGVSVPLPKTLASRTQFRVRLRAQQLRSEPRWRMVWAACGISWAFGAATAPYVWRGLEWAGHRMGVADIIWELGFGLWWALPAVVVAVILLMESAGRSSDAAWKRQGN